MNKQIVRLLLKYTETMSHEGRLIQVIPNEYIENIADEIEVLVNKNSVIHDVSVCVRCNSNNICKMEVLNPLPGFTTNKSMYCKDCGAGWL